ncbi:MAG: S-layer homology domain-containing protein [Armatimonadota bacterium]
MTRSPAAIKLGGRLLGLTAIGFPLLIAVVLLVAVPSPAQAAPIAWAIPSLERVGPTDPAGSATEISLYAARGEYESFQIIVRAPAGGLTNVNVTSPDLGGPTVTLYREHYVYLTSGSSEYSTQRNKPLGPGWYPDGLIPFVNPATGSDLTGATLDAVPFALAADRNVPIWVDVYVPRSTTAGVYRGAFIVTSDQGQASVTLNLTVWNFSLPVRPYLRSSFLYWGMRRQLQPDQELIRNRLMPISVATSQERALIDSLGLNSTNLGFYAVSDKESGITKPTPTLAEVEAEKAKHQPDLYFYNYTADEILGYTSLYEPVRAYSRVLHAAGVDNLVTVPPISQLMDDGTGTGRSAVDVWVELPKQYDAADVAQVLAKGDEVWSYNCLAQDGYSPKWLLDYAPINYRIQPGFINQSLNMTGLLYWSADLWSADPWNDVETYAPYFPGEGMLVYPADDVGLAGVVPSMRLKYLRDGVDDYDYVALLKERGLGDWALAIARTVGPDWDNWTRDPVLLESARRQLGQQLSDLGGPAHSISVTASADPAQVGSGGSAALSGSAVDSEGHAISYWHWSDGGAGGSFAPSADAPNPTYTAPANSGTDDRMIVLAVTASCGAETGSALVTLSVRAESAGFPDVPPDHWAYREVMACVEAGIVTGYPDHLYRPGFAVTRGQMAAYISRALAGGDAAIPEVTGDTHFLDVPADHWAARYVEYATAANIVTGYSDGRYQPDWVLSRGQMSVFIARAMVDPTGEGGLASYTPPSTPTFLDVPELYWAYRHIEYTAGRGVATGYPDQLYRPSGTCTRDQMAVYVARAFELIPDVAPF